MMTNSPLKYGLLALLFLASFSILAQKDYWSERIARSEMVRFPEPWMIEKAKSPRWGYTHGLVVKAMIEEWKHTSKKKYFDYAKIYADSLIDIKGRINMNYPSFSIDNINPGKILFDFLGQNFSD